MRNIIQRGKNYTTNLYARKIGYSHLSNRGKNHFAEVSKNLAKFRSRNNFTSKYLCKMLKHDNNVAKNCNILAISLSILYNYFDSQNGQQTYFITAYLAKFSDIVAKPFFTYISLFWFYQNIMLYAKYI